ncbi:MAG: LTA synthase family protein [Firmicutes bacterium]|nr:LTA synthase family protein [Bacillota bacterium]MDD6694633.1 LTA synthase family protein [Bacillota bacterium]
MKQKTKENLKSIRSYMINNYLISVLLILVIEVLARHSLTDGIRFVWDHPFLTLLSAAILTAFYALALLVPKRNFVWLCITVVIVGLAVTNSILLCFRITPLAATDIALLTSVFEIMGVYLKVWQIILLVLLVLVVIAGLIYLGIRMKKQVYHPLLAVCNAVISILAVVLMIHIGDARGWLQTEFANLPDAYADNGFVYCFTRSLFDRGISKPDTYDEDTVDNILEDMKKQKTNEVEEKPNIIFIQLESFMDLKRMQGVTYSEEPTPVYSSLRKTCPGGFLKVPSVGAGTANTEFEILTGMTLDYFGAGEYPYKTILQDETCESMAYNLRELGYRTGVLHNNTGSFYSRNKVFANLGFDYFVSSEYMENLSYNPIGWAKDKVLTGQIQHILKATSEPDLIYTITVQDHGKYPTELLENPHIKVSGFAPEDEERQNAFTYYVNQCHETDAFLGSLIATLNAFEEPVVLVLYGDHLPNLDITEEELASGNLFQTEYVIWSNKKMLEDYELSKKNENLYAYQLSAHVLKLLGMNNGLLTKFHQMYHNYDNYKLNLKILQYDMLYGKKEVYDGLSPYEPTDLQMGFDPIRITDVSSVGGSVYVMGKNFTESSFVFIDGKKQDTVFLNENTLMVSDKELEGGEEVYVAQLTEVSAQLSSTEVFIYGD